MKIQNFSGKVAEYLLAAELIKRHITPSWPSVESDPYDLICWTGKRAVRLQVKGTEQKNKTIWINSHYSQSGKRRRYTKKQVDFLTVYIFETDDWYIIPIEKVSGVSMRLKPYAKVSRYSPYRNAWHLLK